MSICEKCWADAGGNHELYLELLKEREANPCTPEQQKGHAEPPARLTADALDDLLDAYAGALSHLAWARANSTVGVHAVAVAAVCEARAKIVKAVNPHEDAS